MEFYFFICEDIPSITLHFLKAGIEGFLIELNLLKRKLKICFSCNINKNKISNRLNFISKTLDFISKTYEPPLPIGDFNIVK